MPRLLRTILFAVLACAVGAAATWALVRPRPRTLVEGPMVIERMREVARLETLDVSLYEIVHFKPAGPEVSGTLETVYGMAKDKFFPDEGKAVVFATAHVGLDLSRLDREHVRIAGDRVDVVLPPLQTMIELKPAETLVLESNLTSQQTMELLDEAKLKFEAKVRKDARLQERAKGSSERAIRALLITLGYQNVRFVETLPPLMNPG